MKQQPRSRSPHGRPEYTGTCCAGDSEERKETEREVRQNDGGGSGMNVNWLSNTYNSMACGL